MMVVQVASNKVDPSRLMSVISSVPHTYRSVISVFPAKKVHKYSKRKGEPLQIKKVWVNNLSTIQKPFLRG